MWWRGGLHLQGTWESCLLVWTWEVGALGEGGSLQHLLTMSGWLCSYSWASLLDVFFILCAHCWILALPCPGLISAGSMLPTPIMDVQWILTGEEGGGVHSAFTGKAAQSAWWREPSCPGTDSQVLPTPLIALNASSGVIGARLQYCQCHSDHSLFFIATILVTALLDQSPRPLSLCLVVPASWPKVSHGGNALQQVCPDSEAVPLGHRWTEMGWRPQMSHFQQELCPHGAVKILP